MKLKTERELLEYTANIKGKTFKEIDSENLLYSTSMFGYKIVNAGFQDFSLNMDNEEFKDNDKFIFINLILAPNIKEDESEGV